MTELVRAKANALANFKPEQSAVRIAALGAAREHAKRIKDWEALTEAVMLQIAEQAAFVTWWDGAVGVRHRPPGGKAVNADRRSQLTKDNAEAETEIKQQQVSRWRKWLQTEDKYQALLYGAAYRKAMAEKTDQRGASGTGENEWYTPDEYLAAARDVLGGFDLDPASSDRAQEKVRAEKYFTAEQDGLRHKWHGRVWLNPPYAQPLIAEFVSKMVAERMMKRVTAGIMLTHNYTDTAWFHEAASCADAICFTRGRIKFYDDEGNIAAPTQGQAFFYFGDDVGSFAERFKSIGFVVEPYADIG